MTEMIKLILASRSPRRREILEKVGVHPICLVPDTEDESERSAFLTPSELVMGLASRKARAAWEQYPEDVRGKDRVLLAADTIVYLNGEVLEKPKDGNDAKRMLSELSGRSHSVFTGMAAVFDGRLVVDCMQTRVWFRSLSDQEIDDYLATGEPMDKAGAYAVQQKGSLFVSRIDGDFFNVVGLSACGTDRMLRDAFGFGLSDCE